MIKLEVCEYCQKCPEFDPKVVGRPETEVLEQFDPWSNEIKKIINTHGDTVVKCKERDKCSAMYIYLKGEQKC